MFKAVARRLAAVALPENQRLPSIVTRDVLERIERLALTACKGAWKRGVWMKSPESISFRRPDGSIEPIAHCHHPIVAEFIAVTCSHAGTLIRYVRHLEMIRDAIVESEKARSLCGNSNVRAEWEPAREAWIAAHKKVVALLDMDAEMRASVKHEDHEEVKEISI